MGETSTHDAPPAALITGASSGIGRALAALLAERGWRLALSARRPEPLEEAARQMQRAGASEAIAIPTDMGDPAAAREMVRRAAGAFGRLDALVNNAGCGELADIDKTTDDILERDFHVNAIGPGAAISEAWPVFRRQGSGRIVNVSTLGTVDPFPGFLSYAGSKAALELFTKCCATEGADIGVRAFSVAPGAVETPMLRGIFSESDIPPDATLEPNTVARVILDCLMGERDDASGTVITVPSPTMPG